MPAGLQPIRLARYRLTSVYRYKYGYMAQVLDTQVFKRIKKTALRRFSLYAMWPMSHVGLVVMLDKLGVAVDHEL